MKIHRLLACLVSMLIISIASSQSTKFRSGIFLHHSTGLRIWGPNGSTTSVPLEINAYNSLRGLTGQSAVSLKELAWPPAGDNEWERWHRIFENQDTVVEDIRPILDTNRIVIIKSCFPSSQITGYGTAADTLTPTLKTVWNYKWHWRSILKVMRQRPMSFFVIWTNAPLVASVTNDLQARLSHEFCRWAKDTLAQGLDPQFGTFPANVYVFDFFHKLVGADWKLPLDYAASSTDSHPNGLATQLVAPQFVREVFDAALSYVSAGPAAKYNVSVSSTNPIAGSGVTITAQLADVNDLPVATSGKVVTWGKTGSGGSFGSPTSTTNGSGVATVTFTTSAVVGTVHKITATDNVGLTGTSGGITTVIAAPDPPSLASPDDKAVGVPINASMQWSPSVRATSYRLQVSTNGSFTAVVLDDSLISTASRSVGPLEYNRAFYWRVRAQNATGSSAFSPSRSFTTVEQIPELPTLIFPADGALGISPNAVLRWNASDRAARYHLQVSNSQTFSSFVINDSSVANAYYQVSQLVRDTPYYWRVRAINSGGVSAFSGASSFRTPPNDQRVPILLSPPEGAIGLPTEPSFNWSTENGSITLTLSAPLAVNTTYFWRVRITNIEGIIFFTDVRSFTTGPGSRGSSGGSIGNNETVWKNFLGKTSGMVLGNDVTYHLQISTSPLFESAVVNDSSIVPPVPPTPTAPANGAIAVPTTPTLHWNMVSSAANYRIQISADQNLSSLVLDTTVATDSVRITRKLLNSSLYYWQVAALGNRSVSASSLTRSFRTIVASPSPPTLLSPNHEAAGVDTSLTLSWRASLNATSYHLVVSLDSAFTSRNVVFERDDLTDTTCKLPRLSPNTVHYWHVGASNVGGTSDFSQTWQFTTRSITFVEKTSGSIPLEFGLSQNYPNPFNPGTAIVFALPKASYVTLKVYDLLGREMATLVSQELGPGYFTARWQADASSGIYFCRIQARHGSGAQVGEFMATRKMMLAK